VQKKILRIIETLAKSEFHPISCSMGTGVL